MQTKDIDLLIKNGTVLTINSDMKVISHGWIAVNNQQIVAMGDDSITHTNYLPAQTIDASGKIVMPGFINSHTHIPMAYFKGLADDLPLHTWLNEHIWPKESKMINDEFIYHSSLHGIAELIKNGIVMFNDNYFRGKQIAKAATEAGVRAVIGEGILDFPVAGYENSAMIFDYFISLRDQYKQSKLIDISLSPHSIYTCEKETLQKTIHLAKEYDILLHTHLAETKKEYDDCMDLHKKSPVAYLNDLGFFSDKSILAHCVWLNDEDIDILSEKKVHISVNTKSNLKLASGFIPFQKCFLKGINMTLGTDGVASNNNLSIIEEMGITARVHKALNSDPTALPASEVVKFVTINAAKALGKDNLIGSLEIGKQADIIVIDTDNIESLPAYNPYSQIVYSLSSNTVSDVVINGKTIMYNRQLLTLDEEEIKDRAYYYHKKMIED